MVNTLTKCADTAKINTHVYYCTIMRSFLQAQVNPSVKQSTINILSGVDFLDTILIKFYLAVCFTIIQWSQVTLVSIKYSLTKAFMSKAIVMSYNRPKCKKISLLACWITDYCGEGSKLII